MIPTKAPDTGLVKYIIFMLILNMHLLSCGEDVGSALFNENAQPKSNSQVEEEVEPVEVDLNGNGDYSSLNAAIAAGEKYIIVRSGTYEVTEIITIQEDGVTIEGENKDDVSVIQMNSAHDLFIIKSDHVTIKNLTLDTKTHNAQAVIVEAGASNLTIENNNIYGSSNIIPIFLAGPEIPDGDSEINVYLENSESSQDFSKNNVVSNNFISSNFNGSSISLSLQLYGEITNNTIEGGMINLAISKEVSISDNSIKDSSQSGITINLPASKITISGNTIENSSLHGISMLAQYENFVYENVTSNGIMISNNIIDANIYGLALQGYDDGHDNWGAVTGVSVLGNTINQSDFAGLWIYEIDDVTITSNNISFSNCDVSARGVGDIPSIASRDSAGIHLYDGITNFNISSNTIIKDSTCTDISVAQNAITLSNSVLSLAEIESVIITNNSFVNEASDWMHSNISYLDEYIFISNSSYGDYSGYDGADFHGIDVQNLSIIDEVSVSNNSNIIQ